MREFLPLRLRLFSHCSRSGGGTCVFGNGNGNGMVYVGKATGDRRNYYWRAGLKGAILLLLLYSNYCRVNRITSMHMMFDGVTIMIRFWGGCV